MELGLLSFRKTCNKDVWDYVRNGLLSNMWGTCVQWVGQVWDIDIKI